MYSLYVIYTDTCPHCHSLMKALDDRGIKYERVNVRTDEGLRMARASGSKTVPVVLFDDQYYSLDNYTESQILTLISDQVSQV